MLNRAALTVLLAVSLTSCDESRTGESARPDPTADTRPKLPAGVVSAVGTDAPDRIVVTDPQTGKPVRTVTLPQGALPFDRHNFSPDWSLVAWVGDADGAVRVAELRGDGYTPVGEWKPSGEDRYTGPAFHPVTGRLFVTVGGSGENATAETRVVSVDPRKSGAAPRAEKGNGLVTFDSRGATAEPVTATVGGQPRASAELLWTSQQTVYADVRVDDENARLSYRCVERLADDVLACTGAGEYGTVARLTVDRGGKSVTLRTLVQPLDSPVYGVVAAPDAARLLVNTQEEWVFVNASDGGGLTRVRPELPAGARADPIDWI